MLHETYEDLVRILTDASDADRRASKTAVDLYGCFLTRATSAAVEALRTTEQRTAIIYHWCAVQKRLRELSAPTEAEAASVAPPAGATLMGWPTSPPELEPPASSAVGCATQMCRTLRRSALHGAWIAPRTYASFALWTAQPQASLGKRRTWAQALWTLLGHANDCIEETRIFEDPTAWADPLLVQAHLQRVASRIATAATRVTSTRGLPTSSTAAGGAAPAPVASSGSSWVPKGLKRLMQRALEPSARRQDGSAEAIELVVGMFAGNLARIQAVLEALAAFTHHTPTPGVIEAADTLAVVLLHHLLEPLTLCLLRHASQVLGKLDARTLCEKR